MQVLRVLSLMACLAAGCEAVPSAKLPAVQPIAAPPSLLVVPDQVDCGAVSQCELPPPIAVVLRNPTDSPLRVRGFVATCGCTIPDLKPNVEIAPHSELTVRVRLELWGQGRKQQFIRFIDENSQPLGRLQVRYEVRSTIRSTPSGISREVNPEGSFQIESLDDCPFTLTESYPAVVTQRAVEAATDHSLAIDWAAVEELAHASTPIDAFAYDADGRWSTLLVRIGTDKADCSEVFLWLRNEPAPRGVIH